MRTPSSTLAVLWDESHLWGLLLHRALSALEASFTLVRANEVRSGLLRSLRPSALMVPGGWARLKSEALGEEGRQEIRDFVESGGTYFGFCGGAGLALGSEGGTPCLDLCSWSRKAASRRLPNFSGHLRCTVCDGGPDYEADLPVWWPSQFEPDGAQPLEVVARYEGPGRDFWSADLEWSGVAAGEVGQWEELYGINLNPERLRGEPCVVRGRFGRGAFVLSYAHLETPDSPQANALLCRLLGLERGATVPAWDLRLEAPQWADRALADMQAELAGLIAFGQGHFLLSWRAPWLLGWRRGVPGSPLNFLLAMVWQARHTTAPSEAQALWEARSGPTLSLCREFCRRTRQYLLEERRILAISPSSPEASASPSLQRSKQELFGKFPGYGGLYGEILQALDGLLWLQLKPRDGGPDRP
ncbi:BPL-N domain-containing protein [Desulfomicrobium salsuginis]